MNYPTRKAAREAIKDLPFRAGDTVRTGTSRYPYDEGPAVTGWVRCFFDRLAPSRHRNDDDNPYMLTAIVVLGDGTEIEAPVVELT